jgi:flagella basal body P-ring formation protein FlgA
MIFRPYIAAFALAAVFASAAAAEVRLHDNPSVRGKQITVGDIFRDAGTAARAQLGPAPAPGKTVVYNSRRLVAIARAYGLTWKPSQGGQVVVISSALRFLEKREVTNTIAHELTRLDFPGQIRVELTGRARFPRILVPIDAPGPRLTQIEFDRQTGRLYAAITVTGRDNEIRFRGRAQLTVELPVVTRTIRRGETVADADIDWRTVQLSGMPPDLIMQSADLTGMSVRRTLRAGKPIRGRDLRTPILVRKGRSVVMQLIMPGMKLSGSGRALADAAKGETVQIMNTRSKRIVEGIVTGPDKVIIPMRRQVAVAAAR